MTDGTTTPISNRTPKAVPPEEHETQSIELMTLDERSETECATNDDMPFG